MHSASVTFLLGYVEWKKMSNPAYGVIRNIVPFSVPPQNRSRAERINPFPTNSNLPAYRIRLVRANGNTHLEARKMPMLRESLRFLLAQVLSIKKYPKMHKENKKKMK